jgi:uncharacterized membrane protein
VSQSEQNLPEAPVRCKESFFEDFRRFFVRGLATLLPTLITVVLMMKLWEILWDYLGQHIMWVIRRLSPTLVPDKPIGWLRWWWGEHSLLEEVTGVGLAIVLVYIVGLFVGNFIGRAAYRLMEVGLLRAPLIRAIYPAVKQVTDFLLTDRKGHFRARGVVAVQPHASGIWSIGLVTGPGIRSLADSIGAEMLTVFIPSSPTAFSGYVVIVPRDKVLELPMSVEEAMRLLLTGGVITPAESRSPSAPRAPVAGMALTAPESPRAQPQAPAP